jgi:hypothetical protein
MGLGTGAILGAIGADFFTAKTFGAILIFFVWVGFGAILRGVALTVAFAFGRVDLRTAGLAAFVFGAGFPFFFGAAFLLDLATKPHLLSSSTGGKFGRPQCLRVYTDLKALHLYH